MFFGVLKNVILVRAVLWIFIFAAFVLVFGEVRGTFSNPFKFYIPVIALSPLLLTGAVLFFLDKRASIITGVGIQWAITLLLLFFTQIQDGIKDYQWATYEALDNNRLVFHILFSLFYTGVGAIMSQPITKNLLSLHVRIVCTLSCMVIVFSLVHF